MSFANELDMYTTKGEENQYKFIHSLNVSVSTFWEMKKKIQNDSS